MAKKSGNNTSGKQLVTKSERAVKAFNMDDGRDICFRQGTTEYGLDLKEKVSTKLYPSVASNATYMAEMVECAPGTEDDYYCRGDCGYWLINGTLVPFSFLDKVQHALRNTMLTYCEVVKVTDLFPSSFLTSLDTTEKAVLGACALLLIERGDMAMNFPPCDQEAA